MTYISFIITGTFVSLPPAFEITSTDDDAYVIAIQVEESFHLIIDGA